VPSHTELDAQIVGCVATDPHDATVNAPLVMPDAECRPVGGVVRPAR
jgi:hypothetical protein